jgi:hypothetical protein
MSPLMTLWQSEFFYPLKQEYEKNTPLITPFPFPTERRSFGGFFLRQTVTESLRILHHFHLEDIQYRSVQVATKPLWRTIYGNLYPQSTGFLYFNTRGRICISINVETGSKESQVFYQSMLHFFLYLYIQEGPLNFSGSP